MMMSSISLVIVGVAIATYLTRFPSLIVGRSLRLTPRIKRGLSYIPIGVFASMVAPAMMNGTFANGTVNFPFLGASLLSIVIAAWTKSPLWTMIAGVVSIALLRWFVAM